MNVLSSFTFTCPRDGVETIISSTLADSITQLSRNIEVQKLISIKQPSLQPPICEVCDQGQHASTHYCRDCEIHFCAATSASHKKFKVTSNHVVVPIDELAISEVLSVTTCPTHLEPFSAFDKHCQRLVCMKCIFQSHSEHWMVSFEEACEDSRKNLPALITRAEERLFLLNQSLTEGFEQTESILSGNFEEAKSKIRTCFDPVNTVSISGLLDIIFRID